MTNASSVQALDEQYGAWSRALPPAIQEQFALAKVRASMAQMPDETPIDSDLAAVYLCTSPGTLKRMRAEGTGPKYQQPQTNSGTTARNQKITYLMGEIKRWLTEQSTSSTMHAAELRGTMFSTLQDLASPEPFWVAKVKGVEAVMGHVLATDLAGLISDPEAHIEWLDWAQALALPWSQGAQRKVFLAHFQARLSSVLDGCNSGNEATELIAGL